MQGLIGRKIGMTRFYDGDTGEEIPVTVIETGRNVVHGVRTAEKDGYRAAQLGFGIVGEKRLRKPVLGQFKKAGSTPTRVVREFALDEGEQDPSGGDRFGVEIFEEVKFVDVTGVSKGRGFSGAIKRHNFHRGRETHGNTNHREIGSSGCATYPAGVFPGKRMPGQYGNRQTTVRHLKLVGIEKETGLVYVRGAVPGRNKGIVYIRKNHGAK